MKAAMGQAERDRHLANENKNAGPLKFVIDIITINNNFGIFLCCLYCYSFPLASLPFLLSQFV